MGEIGLPKIDGDTRAVIQQRAVDGYEGVLNPAVVYPRDGFLTPSELTKTIAVLERQKSTTNWETEDPSLSADIAKLKTLVPLAEAALVHDKRGLQYIPQEFDKLFNRFTAKEIDAVIAIECTEGDGNGVLYKDEFDRSNLKSSFLPSPAEQKALADKLPSRPANSQGAGFGRR
jgi:hypothetical protein